MNDYDRNIPYNIRTNECYHYGKNTKNYDKYLLIGSRVVIDTNCFIYNLWFIKEIIETTKITVIIPLVIVMELNGLIRKKDVKKNVHIALKYIEHISETKENVIFQNKNGGGCIDCKNYREKIIFDENIKKIDDIIINICNINKILSNKVFLITSDISLKIKAISNEILTMKPPNNNYNT